MTTFTYHTRPRQAAFTLIELLVVISIISLLISILLPALSTARQAARSMQCGSNIRQIMIGLTNYSIDNNDRLPESQYDKNLEGRPFTYWPQALATRNGYVAGAAPFFCPEHDRSHFLESRLNALSGSSPTGSNEGVYAVSYAANRYGAMPADNDVNHRPVTFGLVDRESELVVLMEGLSTGNNYGGHNWINLGSSSVSLAPRHGTGTRAWGVYMDGHAIQHPAEELGWNVNTQFWYGSADFPRDTKPWFNNVYTQ